MALAERHIPANRFALAMLNHAIQICGLVNGQIAPLTTVTGSGTTSLEGLIRSVTVHENLIRLREQCADAMFAASSARLGLITDTQVGTADTLTGLRNLFAGADSNILSNTDASTFAFPV